MDTDELRIAAAWETWAPTGRYFMIQQTQQLPDCIIYLQALGPVFNGFGTLLVAACVAYIAWRQWETARHKLRMDLYDKRLDAYHTISGFYDLWKADKIDEADFDKLTQKIREVSFLFDQKTNDAVEELFAQRVLVGSDGKLSPEDAANLDAHLVKVQKEVRRQMDLSKI